MKTTAELKEATATIERLDSQLQVVTRLFEATPGARPPPEDVAAALAVAMKTAAPTDDEDMDEIARLRASVQQGTKGNTKTKPDDPGEGLPWDVADWIRTSTRVCEVLGDQLMKQARFTPWVAFR